MDEYYEEDHDAKCPGCGHSPIHRQECTSIWCEDGLEDLYEIYGLDGYDPGDAGICEECHGTGVVSWCPACGRDVGIGAGEDE